MIKSFKKLIISAIVPCVMAVMLPMTAMAAYSTEVSIPVTVKTEMAKGVETLEKEEDIKQAYVVTIAPDKKNPDAPMPEKAEIPVTKSGEISFGPIAYTVPNDYFYTITQTVSGEKSEKITLSEVTSYDITVRVINAKDADGKDTLSAIYWAGNAEDLTEKPNSIAFNNTYNPTPKPNPGPNGGGGGGGGSSTRRPSGDALIGDDGVPLAVLGAFEEDPIPLAVLPMTGDVTNMALWMLMFVISAFGLAGTLVARKKIS